MLFLCLCYFDRDAPGSLAGGRRVWRRGDPEGTVIIEGQVGKRGLSLAARAGGRTACPGANGLAESDTRVGAFLLVHAETIDEAAIIAAKHPSLGRAKHGAGIEIRPIDAFEMPGRVKRRARAANAGR